MPTQYSSCGKYKLEGNNLYKLTEKGDAWMHCTITTKESINAAIKDYEARKAAKLKELEEKIAILEDQLTESKEEIFTLETSIKTLGEGKQI